MYLIAGLGNPGRQYEHTRHNMGFDTVDALVERHQIPQSGVRCKGMYGKGVIAGEKSHIAETADIYEFKWRVCARNCGLFQD